MYVYILEPIVPRPQKEPIVQQHLHYLERLKRENKLICSGPFADKSGGLVCIAANSLEEARTIANSDPFIVNGVDRIVFLKEWIGTFQEKVCQMLNKEKHP